MQFCSVIGSSKKVFSKIIFSTETGVFRYEIARNSAHLVRLVEARRLGSTFSVGYFQKSIFCMKTLIFA